MTILSSHAFSSHSFKIEYLLSLSRWPNVNPMAVDGDIPKTFPDVQCSQAICTGRFQACIGIALVLFNLDEMDADHFVKTFIETVQSIVALMSRPMPSEIECFNIKY